MSYFIYGVSVNGGHFSVDDVPSYRLSDEAAKIEATVAYFGGGAVTVFEMGYPDVRIYSFVNVACDEGIFDYVVRDSPVDNDSES